MTVMPVTTTDSPSSKLGADRWQNEMPICAQRDEFDGVVRSRRAVDEGAWGSAELPRRYRHRREEHVEQQGAGVGLEEAVRGRRLEFANGAVAEQ
jgi:hypothetical protein